MVSVLLIPGHMCDGRLWRAADDAVINAFADLGATPDPVSVDDQTITAMATALLAKYSGALVLVGFSMGGIVALEMARLEPRRMRGLAVLDTNPSADLPERSEARVQQQAAVRQGALERIVVEELKPLYLAERNRSDGALQGLLRDMALTLGPETFVRQSEALRTRADLQHILPDLSMPAFVACGEEDRLCPPAWHTAMAAKLRDAELHVIPGAGHMLPLERPRELASRLANWVRSLQSS